MPNTFLIVGAGITGPTAALRLAQDGHKCTIYERTATPQTIGGAVNLAPNGMRLFARLGLRDAITAQACTVPAFDVLDERGTFLGQFTNRSRDGFSGLRIMRSALQAVLLEELRRRGVEVHFAKPLASISEEGDKVVATFTDGSSASADYLIGADGIHSTTRRYVCPSGPEPEFTKQALVYGIMPTSALPDVDFAAWPATAGVFTRRGFFAMAFADQARDTLYWIAARTKEKAERGLDGARIRAEEGERYAALYDPLPRVIAATDDFYAWPVYELPPLEAWHRGRAVLVGDAAHALPPNLGQGVSVAVEDVFMLARVVGKGAGFQRYEALRRPRVEKLRATMKKQTRERERGVWAQWVFTWAFWVMLTLLKWLNYIWEWDNFAYDPDTVPI